MVVYYQVGPCFEEAFHEVEKVLAKNIMEYVESLETYQIAMAGHFIEENHLSA